MRSRTARSAGILLHRPSGRGREVLLIHPGGPYWRRREEGAWQIPKGGIQPGEAAIEAALREFAEELGSAAIGDPVPLGMIRQAGGKRVEAFAIAGDLDPETISSNSVEIEWPPRSGRLRSYPEVDRAGWFTLAEARAMMLPSQLPLLERLEDILANG